MSKHLSPLGVSTDDCRTPRVAALSNGRRRAARSTPAARLAQLGALLLVVLAAADSHATVRPDPLAPEPGCERWFGSAGGNDPSVQIDLVICPKGEGLEGQLQWSSLQSGWNLRAVQGRWTGGGNSLELADVRIVKEKPNPGWRFCPIDRYELARRGPDSLEGHYVSTPCRDRASVSLTRATPAPAVDAGARPPTPELSPSAPPSRPTATPPSSTSDEPTGETRTRCGCRVVGTPASRPRAAGPSVLLLLGAMLVRRRVVRARSARRARG